MSVMSSGGGVGAAAKAAQSTAGGGLAGALAALYPGAAKGASPASLSVTNSPNSAAGMYALVNPGAPSHAALGPFSSLGLPLASQQIGNSISAHPAAASASAPAKSASASPPLTLGDLQSIIMGGTAPSAPQASDFGPAPTLGDFFSATPYQNALQAVAKTAGSMQPGDTTAGTSTGTINSAFNNALNQIQGYQNTGATQDQNYQNQMTADQQRTSDAVQAAQNQAQALGGAGVAAALAPQRANMAEQQGAENGLMSTLAQLQGDANMGYSQGAALNHQGALNALAAGVQAEGNKINTAEAADQAKGQQLLNAANSARATAMAKAETDYQNSVKSYNSQWDSIMKNAVANATANAPTNRQVGDNIWQGWAQSNNNDGTALNNAAQSIVYGGKNSKGVTIPAARNAAEAYQRLNQMAPAFGGQGSIMYNMLNGMLQNYYSPGKAAPSSGDVMAALKAYAGM